MASGRLLANLPLAGDLVLDRRQLGQAHRPAGVELLGADADLGAKAELEAVGEAGRGVDVDAGRVNPVLEGLGTDQVLGDDALRVVGYFFILKDMV